MDYNKWAKYELYDFLLIDKELADTTYLYNNAPDFNDEKHSFFFFTDRTITIAPGSTIALIE